MTRRPTASTDSATASTAPTSAERVNGMASPAPVVRASLPPAGPVWGPTVMGTGILATLLGRETDAAPALLAPAAALMVVAVALLAGLTVGFVRRVVSDRGVFLATIRDLAVLPTWGTVSMGILAAGSAVLTVAPQLGGESLASGAAVVDAVLWSIGTALGLVTTFGFAAVLIRQDAGRPLPAWGLPVVPPMVSATTGAALVPHVEGATGRLTLTVASVACFFLSLFVGSLVFAIVYRDLARGTALPLALSVSAWIPLGMVGQSTAAAQALADQAAPLLTAPAAHAAHELANAYGYVMLLIAVPVVAYAVRLTVRGMRGRMPFSPGWWALTFPIGTLALGSRLLGEATGPTPLGAVISGLGIVAIAALVGTWTWCSIATLRAVRAARRA